jgi:hypothetical protein
MDKNVKEKMLKILTELRNAEQSTINALNHLRDLEELVKTEA